jgi:hypothetical protein
MEPWRLIRSGIAASALGHLSALGLVVIFAEAHPFASVTAEPMTVDLVSPAEVPPPPAKQEPLPSPKTQPSDAPDAAPKPAAGSPPPSAPPPAAAQPQKQAAPSPPRPNRQQAAAQPPAPAPAPTPAPPPPPASVPAYVAPEPDVSVKYHVMLGLPPELPQVKSGDDNFDSPASKLADISSNLVAEFRRHLKTCAKLPDTIEPSDRVKIVLRVFMTLEGKLAAEPILIEASASAKGPLLMQGAISALQACQPYAMLPADRYGEWKVLDLSFTPRDFAGG